MLCHEHSKGIEELGSLITLSTRCGSQTTFTELENSGYNIVGEYVGTAVLGVAVLAMSKSSVPSSSPLKLHWHDQDQHRTQLQEASSH